MAQIFGRIIDCYQKYSGKGEQFVLFLLALCFLVFFKKNVKVYGRIRWYSYFVMAVMICPLTAVVIMDYLIGEEVYWRMFWLIPVPVVIAIAGVELVDMGKTQGQRRRLLLFVALLIILSGRWMYGGDTVTMAQNAEKLPEQVEDVCDAISADALNNQISTKKVVVPAHLLSYIRQYDATIEMPYGRNGIKNDGYFPEELQKIVDLMDADKPDYFLLSGYLKRENCNYLVLGADKKAGELVDYGYFPVAQTQDYVIYRCDDLNQHAWRIIQYPSEELNSMFYTIQSDIGELIVVDGGWKEDAKDVHEVIKKLGNKVDAWIVTHPHQDHAGAFCVIYPDPEGMEISKVYAPDMPSEELCKENAPWDTYETLEAFQSLDISQLEYVHKGDELDIGGLKIDVLSAYDDYVDENSNDLLNDGSVMFQVSGQQQSMLFCADVGISMSDYLVNTYGDGLKSDYIQMGHHGNGGLSEKFYRLVDPKVAFFDANEELMNPPEGSKWTTPKNRALMESLGANIIDFTSEGHTVILK